MTYPTPHTPPGRHHFGPPHQQPPDDQRGGYASADRGWGEPPGFPQGQPPPAQQQEPSWWDRVDPAHSQNRGWTAPSPAWPQEQAGPVPPTPQPAWSNEPPTQDEIVWADVRRQVATSLKTINSKHCHEAFDRLGKRNALGPHGIVLFYAADDRTQPHGFRLLFVTRLFLAGPESDDLAQVINEITRSAAGNITRANGGGRRWDPRGPEDSMVNGGAMDMPVDAEFVGTGVSTLDTEMGTFDAIATSIAGQPFNSPRAKSVFDIPGQGLALLTDGTALRALRDPDRRLGDDGITCNKTLDPARARYWNPHFDLTTQGDQAIRAAWSQLAMLQKTLQDYLLGRAA
jgi:hypothetical protein